MKSSIKKIHLKPYTVYWIRFLQLMETAVCYAAVSAVHMNTKTLMTSRSMTQCAQHRITAVTQATQVTDIRKHPIPNAALKPAATMIFLSVSISFPAKKNYFLVRRSGSAGAGHMLKITSFPTAGTERCTSCDASTPLTVTVPCVLCSAGRSL